MFQLLSSKPSTTDVVYYHSSSALSLLGALLFMCCLLLTSSPSYAASKQQHTHIGAITQQTLLANYQEFASHYQDYQLTSAEENALASISSDITLEVYLGTWCHDSVREVPRLLKSFADSDIAMTMIALDKQKTDPKGLAKAAGVKFTPTIIVSYHGRELGRIIERPKHTLAEDILAMYQAAVDNR